MTDHHSDEPLHERARRALQHNPDWRSDGAQLSEAISDSARVAQTPAEPAAPRAERFATGGNAPIATSVASELPAPFSPSHTAGDQYTADLQRRMLAIHRLREEAPLLENCGDYHTYLTQKLAAMTPDSVDYPTTLARLGDVHVRLIMLRGRHEEDEAVIRSTQYLVPLLQVPEGEVGSNHVKA